MAALKIPLVDSYEASLQYGLFHVRLRETALKETDVRLWVDHLNHISIRRKHSARRAAERENDNKGTAW